MEQKAKATVEQSLPPKTFDETQYELLGRVCV